MIKFDKNTKEYLLGLQKNKGLFLDGTILKLIDPDGDVEFSKYLKQANEKDKLARKNRLTITKEIQKRNNELLVKNEENSKLMSDLQEALAKTEHTKCQIESQNSELIQSREENIKINEELKEALKSAEDARILSELAKNSAENNLDVLQKKLQFEWMGIIIKVAMFIIIGVGIFTTALYMFALYSNKDTQIIGSTWSNMFGILLTNAFSIVGTIMGVKYASNKNNELSP
jgi:hypothetical protein